MKEGFELDLSEVQNGNHLPDEPEDENVENVFDNIQHDDLVDIKDEECPELCEAVIKLEPEKDDADESLIFTEPPSPSPPKQKKKAIKRKSVAVSSDNDGKTSKKPNAKKAPKPNGEPSKKRCPKNSVDRNELVPCQHCGKMIRRFLLATHVRLSHTDPPAKCDICNKMYKTSAHLVVHKKNAHSEESFPCDQCDKVLKSEKNRRTHIKQVHLQVKHHLCPECGMGFYSKFKLTRHMSSRHRKLKVECDICGKQTTNLYEHRYSVHKILARSEDGSKRMTLIDRVQAKCDECDTTFETAAELNNHQIATRHCCADFVYQCCDTDWVSPTSIQKHNAERHDTHVFPCSLCPVLKSKEYCLNNHINTFHRSQGFSCDKCPKTFTSMSSLKRHMVMPHDGPKEKFPCTLCDKVFSLRKELYNHTANDHEKNLQCPHCDFKTAINKNLAIHISTKHAERPFKCQHCPKTFVSATRLSDHFVAYHSGS